MRENTFSKPVCFFVSESLSRRTDCAVTLLSPLQTMSSLNSPSTLVLFTQKPSVEDVATKISTLGHIRRSSLTVLQGDDAHLKRFGCRHFLVRRGQFGFSPQ